MKVIFLYSFLFLSFAVALPAAEDAGTGDIFSQEFSPRASALGGAYVAGLGDASSVAENPGALDSGEQPSLAALHAFTVLDSGIDYVGFHCPSANYGGFGLGIFRTGISGIPYRDSQGVANPGLDFSYEQDEYLLGYGKELYQGLALGTAARFISQNLFGQSAAGAGVDLGLAYRPQLAWLLGHGWSRVVEQNLRLGLALDNAVAPEVKLGSQTDRYGPLTRLGAAWLYRPEKSSWELNLFAQVDKDELKDVFYALGLETRLFSTWSLRAGFNSDGLSYGGGLSAYGFDLDFAFVPTTYGTLSRFGLAWRFGKPVSQQRKEQAMMKQLEVTRLADQVVGPMIEKARQEARQEAIQLSDQERQKALKDEAFKSIQYIQGLEAYNSAHYAEAISAFETVIQVDPHYLKARDYLNLARAKASHKESEGMSGETLQWYRQGIARFLAGDYSGAIAQWQKILDKEPANRLALRNIQEAQRRLNVDNSK